MRRLLVLVAALLQSRPAAADAGLMRARHKSYVAVKNEQVMASFFIFRTQQQADRAQDPLRLLRERDELLLPAGRAPSLASGGLGAAMLAAGVVLAAHAPASLRPLVDGPVHLGPALYDGGGMGLAVGGKF